MTGHLPSKLILSDLPPQGQPGRLSQDATILPQCPSVFAHHYWIKLSLFFNIYFYLFILYLVHPGLVVALWIFGLRWGMQGL